MNTIKKIAVIGGTGKSGKYLTNQLLNQGFYIKMLVRNPEKLQLQHPLLEVLIGNVKEHSLVKNLLDGCYAVISTLGLGIPPSEPTLFSMATQTILQAMHECGITRYIVTTGLNVDTPFDQKVAKANATTQWMYANYPQSTADRQKEYNLLAESNIDWTLVRLPLIELTDNRTPVSISIEDCPGDKISATDLAYFLISQLMDTTYIKKAPFIANR